MKVSIIVPVYGVEQYLEKCLKSLLDQTFEDLEIILVNDGSLDNSQMIIDRYLKIHPQKIKSIIKENGGQGSARNVGLQNANGEYIAYIDSDDYIEPNMIELLYNKSIISKSDIVICGLNVVDTEYKLIKSETSRPYNNKELDILFGKTAVWNKLYRKEILIENQIEFRKKMWYEDLDFSLKLMFQNYKIDFVDENLYNYLLRPGSTMNNSNVKRNLELTEAFDEIINFYIKKNTYESIKEKIEILCIDNLYISAITRVLCADASKDVKIEVINKFVNYINEKFPNFKQNKYILYLPNNRKIIFKLINNKMYFFVKIIFKFKNLLKSRR